ncbi:MAG: hypothetical protein II381_03585, partial [Victivallales bacterium]|nr:hypothetical protein [Victivallales bacterium]
MVFLRLLIRRLDSEFALRRRRVVRICPHDLLLSVESVAFSQYAKCAHAGEEGTDEVQTKKRILWAKPWGVPVHSKTFALPFLPCFSCPAFFSLAFFASFENFRR